MLEALKRTMDQLKQMGIDLGVNVRSLTPGLEAEVVFDTDIVENVPLQRLRDCHAELLEWSEEARTLPRVLKAVGHTGVIVDLRQVQPQTVAELVALLRIVSEQVAVPLEATWLIVTGTGHVDSFGSRKVEEDYIRRYRFKNSCTGCSNAERIAAEDLIRRIRDFLDSPADVASPETSVGPWPVRILVRPRGIVTSAWRMDQGIFVEGETLCIGGEGDWIIRQDDGSMKVFPDDVFFRLYERVADVE